ncbi:MAG: hypothetical protein EBX52_00900 [Proteobacteria bacterium]|nr:hypothetical protein [Pseudomonadota bacterium]
MIRKCVLIGVLLVAGCAPRDSKPVSRGLALRSDASRTESLRGLRVQELFVVVFPKNYTVQEWKGIFEETNTLSHNKQRLREIEGQTDPQIEEERSTLIGKNAEILMDLGSKSLFMMSWSTQDENCKISKDSLMLVCKPLNPDNPMNGGLPKNTTPLSWLVPDPVRSDVKTPYVSIRLERKEAKEGEGFGIELRLKPESLTKTRLWFKGDVVIDKGSVFPSATDGTRVKEFFPYGYSEMTLAP